MCIDVELAVEVATAYVYRGMRGATRVLVAAKEKEASDDL